MSLRTYACSFTSLPLPLYRPGGLPRVGGLFHVITVMIVKTTRILWKNWDLSRERESSEQFVWLNRRYGETETQLSRSAITPSIRADASQNEMI